ncbi:hypothetical protein ACGFIR_01190 [Micromonospora sp. NPDC049051]|uniref:hypothetical protein n=1 Tax=Micromonospora sp. NPDC049051 TaxID=3364264 RepID=UPI0037159291
MKREALSRRWPWVVLSFVVMAGTGALAVPAAWAVKAQVEAEQGERAPDAAVAVYLLRLSSGDDGGLRRVLAGDRRDELVRQWRAYRAQMSGSAMPPSKLESGPLQVDHVRDGVALVVTEVYAVWWLDQVSQTGSRHSWRFEVREDRGGWRVWSVKAPAWCGAYIRPDRC